MLTKTEALVILENAGVRRSDRWLVRGVGLSLHPGDIVTLIGPTGSGKSTTAKVVLKILKPDEGEVRRSKKTMFALSGFMPSAFACSGAGMGHVCWSEHHGGGARPVRPLHPAGRKPRAPDTAAWEKDMTEERHGGRQ